MENGSQFFSLRGSDKLALVLLLLYTVVTFSLIQSDIKIAGVSIFGWLMGLMMFLAPIISLVAMASEKNNKS
jgi:hypothetical protein